MVDKNKSRKSVHAREVKCQFCNGTSIVYSICLNCMRKQHKVIQDRSAVNNKPRPMPPEPTMAMPGSEAKIEVMRDRWAAGYQIFHPLDATLHPSMYDDYQLDFIIPKKAQEKYVHIRQFIGID